jgi:hypothetical protein
MKMLKWAAVAVTVLFVLMNLGAAVDASQDGWVRVVGGVLGVAGIVAAAGLATSRAWGRAAVITVGAGNVAAAVIGLFAGQEGSVIGLVVGGLAVLLGVFAGTRTAPVGATA